MYGSERLAIDGGRPVIDSPLPAGVSGPSVFGDEEVAAAERVIRGDVHLRYQDSNDVALFEEEARQRVGTNHALMVNSGTSALACGLAGLGIGPGDEVIVPGYTYIATPAAVVAVGAVPVIAEIDNSLGMDPQDMEAKITPHTKAVIPVHMNGTPARLSQIVEIATRHGLKVLEDCCQCVGGEYRGRPVGTYGNAGAWSLNYFKTISSGEGGLLFTDDRDVYERASFRADPGMRMWQKEGWQNAAFPGETYRPSVVLGAIARVQLGKLDMILGCQRAMQAAFLGSLEEARGYVIRHMDDPAGDTGVSATLIFHDAALARGYALALEAEGLPAGTVHNEGIPDRHIYSNWESILQKRSHHPSGYPWRDPAYTGTVEYSEDMCPRTLDILGRSVRFDFNMNMTPEHAKLMAKAVNKVDRALGA